MLKRLTGLLGGSNAPIASPRSVPLAEYDRALKVAMAQLPLDVQVACAAASAERLQPAYEVYRSDSGFDGAGVVRTALDAAWERLTSESMLIQQPGTLVETCFALIPDVDDDSGPIPPFVEDAIASVGYTLTAAIGRDPAAVGAAVTRVTDTLDEFILSTDVDYRSPDAEQQVWEHPLIQTEVNRRRDDLERLNGPGNWAAAVEAVRASATSVSAMPLDKLSFEA